MKTRIERLLEKTNESESLKVSTLNEACEQCLANYKADNDAKKLRDWQAADKALTRLIKELEEKYFDAPPAFDNLMEAVRFLQEEGYKVQKSKVYQDKNEGLIRANADGTILESEILAYAAGLRKIKGNVGQLDSVQADRAKAELRKIEAQEEKIRFTLEKEKGKYLLKSDVYMEIALKLGTIEAAVKHLIQTKAVDYIYATGGNPKKSQVFIDLMYADIDELWNEFCEFEELNIQIGHKGIF